MRHLIAAAVLVVIAMAATMGVATVLQNMAMSRAPQSDAYTPPSLSSPAGKTKPGDNARVMMSRRMNDENNERNDTNSE